MNRFFTCTDLIAEYRLPQHVHNQLFAEVLPVEKTDQGIRDPEIHYRVPQGETRLSDDASTVLGHACRPAFGEKPTPDEAR